MGAKGKSKTITKAANVVGAIVLSPQGAPVDVEGVYHDSIAMHHAVERGIIEGKVDIRSADAFTRSSITKLQYCIELERSTGCYIEENDD